jgi:hypothetical protein
MYKPTLKGLLDFSTTKGRNCSLYRHCKGIVPNPFEYINIICSFETKLQGRERHLLFLLITLHFIVELVNDPAGRRQ